ncbi:hypothetical protein ACNTMW_27330 [Planosporangium sp. 12N6]|uniref:hypothetical protein n=1 Tax=Planosporangium spinosum TaxID=3402278 RepID=UPI003CE80D4B
MSSPMRNTPVDITAAPRAVIGATAGLIYLVGRSVLGENRVPTAQANAWQAVCADRQRAQERAELERWLANGRRRNAR